MTPKLLCGCSARGRVNETHERPEAFRYTLTSSRNRLAPCFRSGLSSVCRPLHQIVRSGGGLFYGWCSLNELAFSGLRGASCWNPLGVAAQNSCETIEAKHAGPVHSENTFEPSSLGEYSPKTSPSIVRKGSPADSGAAQENRTKISVRGFPSCFSSLPGNRGRGERGVLQGLGSL